MSDVNKTCISYWFPRIEAAGLPVPRTDLLCMDGDTAIDFYRVFDGKAPGARCVPFCEKVAECSDRMGYPCFLRTGLTSGKHNWDNTCHLGSREDILIHVIAIIEYSECVDMMGLPFDVWAVREMLPVQPLAVCRKWANMPVCREFRVFVNDDKVQCMHPYWPSDVLDQGGAVGVDGSIDIDRLNVASVDDVDLYSLASSAGEAVGGSWSVDLLTTSRGWYVTDMAEADRSYHWPSCRFAKQTTLKAGRTVSHKQVMDEIDPQPKGATHDP